MEPEIQPRPTVGSPTGQAVKGAPVAAVAKVAMPEPRGIEWVSFGEDGFRVGWRIAAFALLLKMVFQVVGFAFALLHLTGSSGGFSASDALINELAGFVTAVVAVAVMARVEERRILDYNLRGTHRLAHFGGGMGAASLSGAEIAQYGSVWAVTFLLVGFVEEGTMRCYAQYTLARGINFWWALSAVAGTCLYLVVRPRGNGAWGVFAFAAVGLIPCLVLHLKKVEGAKFWQAAWATSTFFGFGHTVNYGENWIGIFAASLIGFVFCASVKVTGSAWWAIGCHAAWDWGETFFYGTADSGFTAQGHFFTSTPAGATLWSGGADGPEGSVLVVPVVVLLLAAVALIYGRGKAAAVNQEAGATQVG